MKFSDLKIGDYIYYLHINDSIDYNEAFENLIKKNLGVKIDKFKVHQIIYPGIIQTGPYYAMTPQGNKATYGEKEDNKYINIIYQEDGKLKKLILENDEFSRNHARLLIDCLEGIFFTSKEVLNKYILDYCNKYIHQYEMQIKSIEEKKEKYQKFLNAYRS